MSWLVQGQVLAYLHWQEDMADEGLSIASDGESAWD